MIASQHIEVTQEEGSSFQNVQHRPMSYQQLKPAKLTNIEQLFKYQILASKLLGGYQFEWRGRAAYKRLAIGYRVALTCATKFINIRYFRFYRYLIESPIPRSLVQNMLVFWALYLFAFWMAFAGSILSGVRHHETIAIILKKRLDERYLRPLPFHPPDKSKRVQETRCVEDSKSNRQKLRPQTIWSKLSLKEFVKFLTELERVKLVRFIIVVNVLFGAVMSLVSDEFGDGLILNSLVRILSRNPAPTNVSALNESSQTPNGGPATTIASFDLSTQLNMVNLRSIAHSLMTDADYNRDLSNWLFGNSKRLVLLYPWHLLVNALNYYQVYGHILLGLMITAAMTDMLKRINEQDKETFYEYKSTSSMDQNLAPPGRPTIPTSLVLVQVRDALATLRPVLSLDYLVVTTYDLTRLISALGFFNALLTTKYFGWAFVFFLEYLRLAVGVLITRIGYHLLHVEARKIRMTNQLRLVSADRKSRSHLEALTNYKLAEEIELSSPTDWIESDIKSHLSQNLFVITFVATLQQLVEVGSSHNQNDSTMSKLALK